MAVVHHSGTRLRDAHGAAAFAADWLPLFPEEPNGDGYVALQLTVLNFSDGQTIPQSRFDAS